MIRSNILICLFERFTLGFGVRTGIDISRLYRHMTKYITDVYEVYSGLKQMHSPAVPQSVTADPLGYQVRIDFPSHSRISLQDIYR